MIKVTLFFMALFLVFLLLHLLREQIHFYMGKQRPYSAVETMIQFLISFALVWGLVVGVQEMWETFAPKEQLPASTTQILEKEAEYFGLVWPKGTEVNTKLNFETKEQEVFYLKPEKPLIVGNLHITSLQLKKEGRFLLYVSQDVKLSGWHCKQGQVTLDGDKNLLACDLLTPLRLGNFTLEKSAEANIRYHRYYSQKVTSNIPADSWVVEFRDITINGKYFTALGLQYQGKIVDVMYAYYKERADTKEDLLKMVQEVSR